MLGDTPSIGAGCEIVETVFGKYNEIGAGTRLDRVLFGDYAYCDRYCDIAHAVIGKFSNIASFVRIGATDHPMQRASQHHFQYRASKYWADAEDEAGFFAARRARVATIGPDTWLGHACMVMPEVVVGAGAVVAAGAVVTRDVTPFMIVAGVPAKPIKARFPRDIGERLQSLAWWEWSHEALRAALEDFRTLPVEAFLEKYHG